MKLGFIGLGNMGRAICSGLIQSGAVSAGDICGCALHADRLRAYANETGITACANEKEVCELSETVIVAVKPYVIEGVIASVRDALRGKALVSVVLGYNYARLTELVSSETRVQFVMPNTPALVGEGMILFEDSNSLEGDERREIMALFSRLGTVEELPSRLMGVGGAISGCGPAFCAMVIEALADAGVKYGLPRATAYLLASQTLTGTGRMQIETGMHPGELKDGVCSPAGTTIRGVEALERAGLRAALMDAVQAVMERQ